MSNFFELRLSFSLSMGAILSWALVIAGIITLLVRYRLLTKYSRLPEVDTKEEINGPLDIWGDYPDDKNEEEEEEDFLKAIRVFGYLDKKVYHELTMSRSTLNFAKGEILHLSDLNGFAVVVDGSMNLTNCRTGETVNTVSKSAPLLSISSMLSLFTDDIVTIDRDIIAIAQDPVTIIVISADTFLRLVANYPKAAATIVQVLLYRWSQVTLRTCQHYLDLTEEIFATELRIKPLHLPDWVLQATEKVIEGTLLKDILHRRKSYGGVPPPLSRHSSVVSLTAEVDESVMRTVIVESLFRSINFPVNENENEDDDIVEFVANRLQFKTYPPGTIDKEMFGLVIVLDGELEVYCKGKLLYKARPKTLTGYLETISSYTCSTYLKSSIRCHQTTVAYLPKAAFEAVTDAFPYLWIHAAKTLNGLLTRPILQLDFALEWISVRSGNILVKKDDPADAIYFVLNGRLRSMSSKREYGKGSSVGELEVLVGDNYSSTVVAVRETELARFPRSMFVSLAKQHPSLTFELSRLVASTIKKPARPNDGAEFKTVAILPTSDDNNLPVHEFAQRLCNGFRSNGTNVAMLTNAVILEYLGKYAFQRVGVLKLKAYLSDLEDQHDMLVYVGDSSREWTKTCIEQADCVLLLADALSPPMFGEAEKMMVHSRTMSRAHLVLLHQEMFVPHGTTSKWLRHRPWVTAHHHVELYYERQAPPTVVSHTNKKTKRLQKLKKMTIDRLPGMDKFPGRRRKQFNPASRQRLPFKSDFHRLARILSGDAVGLVLGGGGARGISHIGVIRAIEDAGIPIDMIGGTSIGAFMGGLYAREYDIMPLFSRARSFSLRFGQLWRIVLDITYPYMAWTTGHEFNRGVWKAFGDSRLEDFWIRYFTNTTNLTHSRMEIHGTGYSWRFIRASMSLAGLVPPVEFNGQMLLDGGYVDNLPVSEMKKMGAKHIIAVDVGAVDDTTPQSYGDSLSGLWALLNKWNPLSSTPTVPNIAEIQQRLTYVSSVKALEEARTAPGVLYLRPPIDPYGTLDFTKFEEIEAVGRNYAGKVLKDEVASGKLREIPGLFPAEQRPRLKFRRYSY